MHGAETHRVFSSVLDRWLPLIYKGSIQYSIPGRTEAEDLVQESLVLLLDTIQYWLDNGRDFELDCVEFEKYFKTVFFHRLVDAKRFEQSQKRNHRSEVHATDDYDPLTNVRSSSYSSPEELVIAQSFYDALVSRLDPKHVTILEAWLNPSEELLAKIRTRSHRCLNKNIHGYDCGIEYQHSGAELTCPNCGSETEITHPYSPSKIHQYDIQDFVGVKRSVVVDATSSIRRVANSLTQPDFSQANLSTLLELLGFGTYLDDSCKFSSRPINVASCRISDGPVSYEALTYHHMKIIATDDEMKLIDFCVVHNSPYYQGMKFSGLASRLGWSVHKVRQVVDALRIKIDLVDAGVPLKDIPKS